MSTTSNAKDNKTKDNGSGKKSGFSALFTGKKKDNQTQNKKGDKDSGKTPAGNQSGGNRQPKGTSDAKKVNKSAGSAPGNKSGLKPIQKQDPFVNFGSVIKEFLNSNKLNDKVVHCTYHQSTDKYDISLSYRPILENGVSVGAKVQQTIDEYMAVRTTLLGKNDPKSRYIAFCGRMVDRLGIDLSASKPQVNPEDVERFILRHLSPIERETVKLSKEEWDTVDSNKLAKILQPTLTVVDNHYGKGKRQEFLIKSINSDNPESKEPPNWVNEGLGTYSKATLLNSVRVVKDEKSDKLEQLTLALQKNLLESLEGGEGEESKTENELAKSL